MADAERLQNQGRLVEAEHEAQHLALAMAGHKARIRQLTDPFAPVELLCMRELRVELDELSHKQALHHDLIEKIRRLREHLGLPRYEER